MSLSCICKGSVLVPSRSILNEYIACVKMAQRYYSSSYEDFKEVLNSSKNIVVITGAGMSAESGIPTFRGKSGFWRTHRAADLATRLAFLANPTLVWEFYNYRREVAFKSQPNKGHLALAKYEEICKKNNRNFTIITQNVDGLHQKAGSQEVIELHGALNKVICMKCKFVDFNTDIPICEALKGRDNPRKRETLPPLEISDLPKCKKCQGLVRPHIVWFGENLDRNVLNRARTAVYQCDLCLVVGTSSVVYPAATFAELVLQNEQPVAEFNINDEPALEFPFYFQGPCGETLPKALGLK